VELLTLCPVTRPSKERKAAEPAEGATLETLEKALQASRGETMRAQRDLESARLEMAEQKRRSGQQALVASEALKEARTERDRLRVQLDALRGQSALADRKSGVHALEEAADVAHAELADLRARLAAAESALQEAVAAKQAAEAKLAAAEAALGELRSSPAPVSVPIAPAVETPSGLFRRLFGRR
jgi:chromosome segregation ATPase